MIDRYISVLIDEWHSRSSEITTPISTIYIGGGTPSILSPDQLRRLFEALPSDSTISEYTIEVNPEDVGQELIDTLINSPVNRVSMGIQSLCDSELAAIGRRHTSIEAIEAAHILIKAFPNTSVDLMFGLPGQTIESWLYSIKSVLSLHPAHISAYSLMLEPRTRLYTQVRNHQCQLPSQETNDAMYRMLCSELNAAGYRHYEISNFALPGYQSRHNSNYWNFTPYIGIGASAHSYNGDRCRRANSSSLHQYLSDLLAGTIEETLTDDEQRDEYIMLSLRQSVGLDLTEFQTRFGLHSAEKLLSAARKLLTTGYLQLNDTHLVIPEDKWLVSDSIIVGLM